VDNRAGRASEAVVVPVEPQDNTTCGEEGPLLRSRAWAKDGLGECRKARSTLAAVEGDRVRALQHALYRAAKADPTRRFHALFDKVCRRDVLDRAWEQVRRNRGAAGIDQTTLADTEEYGIDRLLDELAAELRERRYRPLPARRVSALRRFRTPG
jgi:hypothetical protein